jgi:glycosyltransferase involved in cell wall biosynthesis
VRVAFIGQKGVPATYGGVERHVEELAARLAARGHQACVYNRPHYVASPPSRYRGVEVVTLPSVATKHLDAITHVAVCTAHALRHQADVVHYHAVGPALLSWVPRLRGVCALVTIHGRDWQRPKWGTAASLALHAGEWMAMHAPDQTVVVSQSLAGELSSRYRRPARYIPNGITLEQGDDLSILDELGVAPRRYVLFASRLVPEKGAHYLADAWRRQDSDMTLVMAGDSSFSADYVQSLKAACAHDRVVFPGYVFGPRLATLFRNAALFVLPSDVEGLPIVLLEALGYGTPVLASDIPPNREVLGDLGRTFAAGSVDDLGRQLEAALDELPALREQAAQAATAIARLYDWDVVADQTIALYETALGVRRAREGHSEASLS